MKNYQYGGGRTNMPNKNRGRESIQDNVFSNLEKTFIYTIFA